MPSKCLKCNKEFDSPTTGRASRVCKMCYPKYRRAFNLYHAAKHRAKKKNTEFDLDLNWVEQKLNSYCEVTSLAFEFNIIGSNYSNRHACAPSIDRINPTKGYTKNNCRMVVWWYNMAKQRYSDLELWHLCKAVVNSLDVNSVLVAPTREATEVKTT